MDGALDAPIARGPVFTFVMATGILITPTAALHVLKI